MALIFVAIEPEAVAAEEFVGDLLGPEVSGELNKAAEVEIIVATSVGAAAFFDFEGFEEIGDEFGDIHK